MMNITIGQYYPGNSVIHRLDPRTKIICTLIFITAVFLAKTYVAYALLAGFVGLIIIFSRLPLSLIIKGVKPLWFIILLTVLIHFFTTKGEIIFSWWLLSVTQEGLDQGLMMAMRLLFLLIVSSLLTYTTSPIVLTDGIEKLLRPFKRIGVPAHELAMMMTIALRFIPTLLEETDKIMKAQMSRGADFTSGNILNKAKNLVPLLVPLFISAFRRADDLATAMEARCYRGGEGRTRMHQLQLTRLDTYAYLYISGLVLGLAYLRWLS